MKWWRFWADTDVNCNCSHTLQESECVLWVFLWECGAFRSIWKGCMVCMFPIWLQVCHAVRDLPWSGLGLNPSKSLWSRFTQFLVMTWPRFKWYWLQLWLILLVLYCICNPLASGYHYLPAGNVPKCYNFKLNVWTICDTDMQNWDLYADTVQDRYHLKHSQALAMVRP